MYGRPLTAADLPVMLPAEEEDYGRPMFGLAIAPVSWPSSSSFTVLRASFAEELAILVERRELSGLRPRPTIAALSRHCVQQTLQAHHGTWVARVYVRGVAAVAFLSTMVDQYAYFRPAEITDALAPAWNLAADALTKAGAAGDAFLSLHLETTFVPPLATEWTVSPAPRIDVSRIVTIGPPNDAELDSIKRELEREAGYPSWEPEPEA